MDSKSIGTTISELRKKNGLTQAGLAKKLNVSDKTISKWENGLGYPEVTQFPAIARVFGVSIDYLMTGERKGIAIAGNILTDIVKDIDCYPQIGMLSNISRMSRSVGGCVPNTAIDLAKIDRSIPITALGRIGEDESGRYVMQQLGRYGVNTEMVKLSSTMPTGFSDVMSLPSGERTFFHNRGANTEFCPDDVNLAALNSSILHIGYIFLLDIFDSDDEQYGTVMARFLHDAQNHGIKTSIDMVSNSSAKNRYKAASAFKYCDYVIVNEIEACSVFDIEPRDENGKINMENIRKTMLKIKELGAREKVIVHAKEVGVCLDCKTDEFIYLPSLKIPPEEIKGSVGAGDAYCIACLYGIYNGWTNKAILEFASSAAACNLFSETAVDGMKSKTEILEMENKYGRLEL